MSCRTVSTTTHCEHFNCCDHDSSTACADRVQSAGDNHIAAPPTLLRMSISVLKSLQRQLSAPMTG